MVDEQKLRQLAEAATPGTWLKEGHTIYSLMHFGWRKGVEQFKNRFWTAVYKDNDCPEEERQANVDFIASANPAAILAMLDELQTLRSERTAWRVTAENAEAAVKQARIDALEEAKLACEAEADESKLSAPGASDGRYDWKEDGARDCVSAIESLKGKP